MELRDRARSRYCVSQQRHAGERDRLRISPMTTTQLIQFLSSNAELPVSIRLDGYVSEDDPRDGHNQSSAATLEHYTRLSDRRTLAAADVIVTSDPKSGGMCVEVIVKIHVRTDTGEGRGPSVAIGMMSAEDVIGVPFESSTP